MQAILIYLLKVIVCSGLLLSYYWIALRNKQFHQYNRFYLLSTVLLSLLLPLLRLEWFTVQSENETAIRFMQTMYSGDIPVTAQNPALSWQQLTAAFLILSFAVLLIRLLSRVVTIYQLRKKYPNTRLNGSILLIETDLQQAPFSFLSNLFWRKDIDPDEATGQQILQHEITHIREKHTWDKLFLQTILCVYWMNPFFWLLQRELYLIHEFIADQKAVKNKDTSAFAAMLLQAQFGKFRFSPAHPFFYSPIKRRLLMLTTSTDARYSYARRVMVLPVLAAVCTLFALRIQAQKKAITFSPPVIINDNNAGATAASPEAAQQGSFAPPVIIEQDSTKPKSYGIYEGKKVKDVFTNADQSKVMLKLDDNTMKTITWQNAVAHKIKLPESFNATASTPAAAKLVIYADQVTTIGSTPGTTQLKTDNATVESKTIVVHGKKSTAERGAAGKNPHITEITLSDVPHKDTSTYHVSGTVTVIERPKKADEMVVIGHPIIKSADGKEPLFILDGNTITREQLEKLNKTSIESINVLKGAAATAAYGEAGANGVIVVKTKK